MHLSMEPTGDNLDARCIYNALESAAPAARFAWTWLTGTLSPPERSATEGWRKRRASDDARDFGTTSNLSWRAIDLPQNVLDRYGVAWSSYLAKEGSARSLAR